jgi:hypothetical protein
MILVQEIHNDSFAYIVIVYGMAYINQHEKPRMGKYRGPETFYTLYPESGGCMPFPFLWLLIRFAFSLVFGFGRHYILSIVAASKSCGRLLMSPSLCLPTVPQF